MDNINKAKTSAAELRRQDEENLCSQPATDRASSNEPDDRRLLHELQIYKIELEMQNAELRQAKDELETTLDKYADLYDSAPTGYITLDRKGTILSINLASSTLLGIERSRLNGLRLEQFVADTARPAFSEFLRKVFMNQNKESCEMEILSAGNSPLCVQIEAVAAASGEECRVALIDISERKRMELLQQSEERYRTVVEDQTEIICRIKQDGTFTFVNEVYCRIFGKTRDELLGKPWRPDAFTDDVPMVEEQLRRLSPSNPVVVIENRVYVGSGEIRWMQFVNRGYFDTEGLLIEIQVVGRDTTERKEVEHALRVSDERLNLALAASNMGVWELNVQTGASIWSSEVFAIFGIETFDASEESFIKALHPDDVDRVKATVNKALADNTGLSQEYRIIRSDGQVRWLSEFARPTFDDNGSPLRLTGTVHDITERKQAEELLRKSEYEFRMLAESMPQIVWITRPDGCNIYVNQKWVDYTGQTLEESYDHGWMKAFHPDDKQVAWDAWQNATTNGADYSLECRLRRTDGVYKWWLVRGVPVPDEHGAVLKWFGTCTDIDDFKKASEDKLLFEQQMQHTQKLESLGVLSGGIAHDFNNILAIIMGYCALTKMDYETAENNIAEIEKAAERAVGLCRQMMAYAGNAQIAKTQVNMSMLVIEMVTMLKSTLPQNAVIKPDLSANIPFISGDDSQIKQIVMNLIINASEAIGKEQGEIRVSLAKTTVIAGQSDKDYHGKTIPPGEYVCLKVTDNGCGMDEETKWRIFEPFYTTKFTGRGLGMSAVLGIIMSHGGALQLFSQLDQGTTFKVYLPIQTSDTNGDENLMSSVPSAPWQGSGTILLVEDEAQIRFFVKTLLQKFGFTVLEAANGKEALELYRKKAADITLVVTDMGMPVMDGYELFRKLKQLKPDLPIIISSGFGDAEVSSRIASDDIAGLISKPYNPDQLREVLKKAMEYEPLESALIRTDSESKLT